MWIAAYGQIFFSLSIGFGIMITYASYLKPRTNLTATGLVTGFANSAFEVLAGIGVFAALGFMAVQQSVPVDEVAESGIGLSFMAFPAIINEMPAGGLFGVLFFGSLFIAGITSLISIIEVVISAVADKISVPRQRVAILVGVPMAIISCVIFSTSTGLMAVDIVDKFTNNIGIVFCASSLPSSSPTYCAHRRDAATPQHSLPFKVGSIWKTCAFIITLIVLVYTLSRADQPDPDGYGDYTSGRVLPGLVGTDHRRHRRHHPRLCEVPRHVVLDGVLAPTRCAGRHSRHRAPNQFTVGAARQTLSGE